MTSTSPGARIAPVLLGGLGYSGLQLYYLLNAKPGANYGWLIGSFVGCVIGTVIMAVLVARRKPQEPKPPSAVERQQASEKYKRYAKKAYLVCLIAWGVTGLAFIPLSLIRSPSLAAVPGIIALIAFVVGLIALIAGKALGDASKK